MFDELNEILVGKSQTINTEKLLLWPNNAWASADASKIQKVWLHKEMGPIMQAVFFQHKGAQWWIGVSKDFLHTMNYQSVNWIPIRILRFTGHLLWFFFSFVRLLKIKGYNSISFLEMQLVNKTKKASKMCILNPILHKSNLNSFHNDLVRFQTVLIKNRSDYLYIIQDEISANRTSWKL